MNRVLTPICPYCEQFSKRVKGRDIYPNRVDLKSKTFYECKRCKAYVGCHKGTDKPLGRLANPELRYYKKLAHKAFDPLWRAEDSELSRTDAYAWLAKKMNIPASKCHIGMFDVHQCIEAIRLVNCLR